MNISNLILIGFFIFCVGILGVLSRRNYIVILLSIELIFAAACINFVAFSYFWGNLYGQVFTIFIITVAAGEAAIGLALLIVIFRLRATVDVDELDKLKG